MFTNISDFEILLFYTLLVMSEPKIPLNPVGFPCRIVDSLYRFPVQFGDGMNGEIFILALNMKPLMQRSTVRLDFIQVSSFVESPKCESHSC